MTDLVNHPPHYADGWSNGAEVIDITEHLNFNRGNAVKYIARAGKKGNELEDLLKAEWYIQREITRLGYEVPEEPYTETMEVEGYRPEYSWEFLNDECIPPGVFTVVDKAGDLWMSWGRGTADCKWQRIKDGASASSIPSYRTKPFRAATDLEKKHGRTARVWDSLVDVPRGTIVKCNGPEVEGGCTWISINEHGNGWFMDNPEHNTEFHGWNVDGSQVSYGPFVEVLS